MSHTPLLRSGQVIKRKLNCIRPVGGSTPPPPTFPLTIFFGQVQPVPEQTVMGDPLTERNEFFAYLSPGVEVQNFESLAVDYQGMSYPVSPTFTLNSVGMTIPAIESSPGVPFYVNGTAFFVNDDAGVFTRWNTTSGGANWLDACQTPLESDPSGLNTYLSFSPSIAFFGAYFTDFGDWADSYIVIRLVQDNDDFTEYTMENPGLEGGSLTFWGFACGDATFKRIEFYNFGPHIDAWGMDDMTFGPIGSVVGPP